MRVKSLTVETDRDILRLRWQCYRGMLELDLILLDFLDKRFLRLNAASKAQFEKLLHCEDQELYRWFLSIQPPAVEFSDIVHKILQQDGVQK